MNPNQTIPELRAYAKAHGIFLQSRMRKAEIIDAISKHIFRETTHPRPRWTDYLRQQPFDEIKRLNDLDELWKDLTTKARNLFMRHPHVPLPLTDKEIRNQAFLYEKIGWPKKDEPKPKPKRKLTTRQGHEKVLGIPFGTRDPVVIKHAFRELSKTEHPDKKPGNGLKYRAILEAYQYLLTS